MKLLISNVTILTHDVDNQVLTGCGVAIENNLIAAVGPEAELSARYGDYERLDGSGRVLMPGLVNAHNHFYGAYARGLALRTRPANFAQILEQLWWRLDKALDLEGVYYSALVLAINAAKHGVTTIIDHHASPNAIEGSLAMVEQAMTQVGLRGVLCYELSDRDGKQARDLGLAENERYLTHCQAQAPTFAFDGLVGLHASFTLDADSLEMAADLSQRFGRGCHIHVLEDGVDEQETNRKYGVGVVERLARFGILNEKSLVGHAIHLTDSGRDILVASQTMVAHNPQSNMNNAVGRADVFQLLQRGLLVGVGSDGMTQNIRAEARTGYLMHKHHLADPNVGWAEWQAMTLQNNPAIYQRITGRNIGQITPGYLADLILLDYYPLTPLTAGNTWGHFLYGLADAPVNTTIANGQIVMHNKQLPHLDELAIAAASRLCAEKTWQRFNK